MKKIALLFLSLLFFALPVFCQEADGIKDALIALGVNPAIALIISLSIGTALILQAIPEKWAGPLRYVLLVCRLLTAIFTKIDDKLNNGSKKQKQSKRDIGNEPTIGQSLLRALNPDKPLLILALLFGSFALQAQDKAFDGFFKPLKQVVNTELAKENGEITTKPVIKFRTAFAISALAIELSEKTPVTKSFSAAGLGLSLGKYITNGENPYCQYSVNAGFLTTMDFADVTNTKLGFSLTGDVFNKVFGAGLGTYFDQGKPKWLLLFNVSVPL
jgi:hypothetical protein